MERNQFLEAGGLYWESDSHEWFNDKGSTQYAQRNTGINEDALLNIFCFITRNKTTGEYTRVVMDSNTNQIVYDSNSVEEIAYFIDKMKIMKRFKR